MDESFPEQLLYLVTSADIYRSVTVTIYSSVRTTHTSDRLVRGDVLLREARICLTDAASSSPDLHSLPASFIRLHGKPQARNKLVFVRSLSGCCSSYSCRSAVAQSADRANELPTRRL